MDSKVDADGNVYTYGDVSHHAVKQIELLVRFLQGELRVHRSRARACRSTCLDRILCQYKGR